MTATLERPRVPPVHNSPPWLVSPTLEVTHPFHFKMTPGVMLSPTCNHELGGCSGLASSVGAAALWAWLTSRQARAELTAHVAVRGTLHR